MRFIGDIILSPSLKQIISEALRGKARNLIHSSQCPEQRGRSDGGDILIAPTCYMDNLARDITRIITDQKIDKICNIFRLADPF